MNRETALLEELLLDYKAFYGLNDEEWNVARTTLASTDMHELREELNFLKQLAASEDEYTNGEAGYIRDLEKERDGLLSSPRDRLAEWLQNAVRNFCVTKSSVAFAPFSAYFGLRENLEDDWLQFLLSQDDDAQSILLRALMSSAAASIIDGAPESDYLVSFSIESGAFSDTIFNAMTIDPISTLLFIGHRADLHEVIDWLPMMRQLGLYLSALLEPSWFLQLQKVDRVIEALVLRKVIGAPELEAMAKTLLKGLNESEIMDGLRQLPLNHWKQVAFHKMLEKASLVQAEAQIDKVALGIVVPGTEDDCRRLVRTLELMHFA
jgi:hypothetical protein